MRVLAAQFEERDAALRVLNQLRSRYDLRADDAQVAPLGAGGSADAQTLLAGRFREHRIAEITHLIEDSGGTVIADIDEGWTRPPQRGGPAGPPETVATRYAGNDRRADDRSGPAGLQRQTGGA